MANKAGFRRGETVEANGKRGTVARVFGPTSRRRARVEIKFEDGSWGSDVYVEFVRKVDATVSGGDGTGEGWTDSNADGAIDRAGRMSIEKARRFVGGYTAGGTPEQREAIAQRMVEHGECVWHAASIVCGTKCFCRDCRPDVTRFA